MSKVMQSICQIFRQAGKETNRLVLESLPMQGIPVFCSCTKNFIVGFSFSFLGHFSSEIPHNCAVFSMLFS